MKKSTSTYAAIAALAAILLIPTQAMADRSANCQSESLVSVGLAACGTTRIKLYPLETLTYGGYAGISTYPYIIDGDFITQAKEGTWELKKSGFLWGTVLAASGTFYQNFTRTRDAQSSIVEYYLIVRAAPVGTVPSRTKSIVTGKIHAGFGSTTIKLNPTICTSC